MAQPDGPQSEPPPALKTKQKFFRLFGRSQNHEDYATSSEAFGTSQLGARAQSVVEGPTASQHDVESDEPLRNGPGSRTSRSVVPGLPRAQTFKRQLSENRSRLAPVEPTPEERRAVSMDRRSHAFYTRNYGHIDAALEEPNTFEPGHMGSNHQANHQTPSAVDSREPHISGAQADFLGIGDHIQPEMYSSNLDDFETQNFDDDHQSVASTYNDDEHYLADLIAHELETTWILNLSMRYKDRSNREKFFVTYREHEQRWRRVTVTLDYRNAPEGSLEEELADVKSQREKSSKIYESIRQSLQEIQFYETVTNLKLETTDDRLHVHVVEDANEIINYPHSSQLQHLGCRRVKEEDITFNHHMSGFVYKVAVQGETLIKKEIPGPETIDEFLYEINALNSLRYSDNVIKFYGLVVDDFDQVKGLLISYADGGALIDIIYDNCKEKKNGIQWSLKERWAHQIVNGLADVHECGFVQGDFTLSNIVIDEHDNAKIIDINRRGCPVGWEPPEATPLIESQHRISMYIGVKSDLYQLGMVLWAIAMDEDEPEREGRPLSLGDDARVPDWYRQITEICLSADPRKRVQASMLLQLFPQPEPAEPRVIVNDGHERHEMIVNEFHPDGHPRIRIENLPRKFWSPERSYSPGTHPAWQHAPRGRSPPSPMPSNYDDSKSPGRFHSRSSWAANRAIRASYSDAGGDEVRLDEVAQQFTPNTSVDRGPLLANDGDKGGIGVVSDDPVGPAVVVEEHIENTVQDSSVQNHAMDVEAAEDAQATPTQESVGTGVDKDVKGVENVLQEIAGNVAGTDASEAPAAEDTVPPESAGQASVEDTEASEKKTPLETAVEVPSCTGSTVAIDAGDQETTLAKVDSNNPVLGESEVEEGLRLANATHNNVLHVTENAEQIMDPTLDPEEPPADTELAKSIEVVAEAPGAALEDQAKVETVEEEFAKPEAEPASEIGVPGEESKVVNADSEQEKVPEAEATPEKVETEEVKPEEVKPEEAKAEEVEPEKLVVQDNEKTGSQPAATIEADVKQAGCQDVGAQQAAPAQVVHEKGEHSNAASFSVQASAELAIVDQKKVHETAGHPDLTDQLQNKVGLSEKADAAVEYTHGHGEQAAVKEDTDTLPTATADPVAALSDPQHSQDEATPRISPCEPKEVMNQSNSLAGIGVRGEGDDCLVPGKDLVDEDFQLIDRPERVPTVTITTDATT